MPFFIKMLSIFFVISVLPKSLAVIIRATNGKEM